MLKSGFIIRTDHHFQIAIHNKIPVTVWLHGEIYDYGGPIEKVSELSVWINGTTYFKDNCEFKVR